jgi:putative methionine-R-sulfoxide reductase with GAF domain
VTDQTNKPDSKPSLNEQTFGKLLEAAYVLQEHNREMREMEQSLEMHSEFLRQQEAEAQAVLQHSAQRNEQSTRNTADYTLTLAEIVEAQHQIQIRHLQSDQAMEVVADRIARITGASGAGIAVQDGKIVRYRAGAGAAALPVGTEVPLETAICAICLRTGQVLRTPDVDTEFLFDPDLCRQRAIESLVAVPVYHDGNIVGALELYFDRVQGFVEQDIHTCQLMAGLVTEAIGRSSQSALKTSMAEELSSMLATIEKLQPSLAVASDEPAANQATKSPGSPEGGVAEVSACWKCGGKLVADEQFCGKCGAPRLGESDRANVQRVTSAWSAASAGSSASGLPLPGNPSHSLSTNEDATLPHPPRNEMILRDPIASARMEENRTWQPELSRLPFDTKTLEAAVASGAQTANMDVEESPARPAKAPPPDATWTSAAKARDFLDNLAGKRTSPSLARFWRSHRGDVYLVVAIIAVGVVIRWGVMSDHFVGGDAVSSAPANAARRKPSPDDGLSSIDKLLISLGMAEAPEAPEYKGNPAAQVWIDPHTALYYCPGSDLYGKTPNGRFASQHQAQMDQFEPASRKICD